MKTNKETTPNNRIRRSITNFAKNITENPMKIDTVDTTILLKQ